MREVANYNVRFCNVINPDTMEIDLTPAELKEGAGNIIYVIRDIYDEEGTFEVTYYFLGRVTSNSDGSTASFYTISDGLISHYELSANNDDMNYKNN